MARRSASAATRCRWRTTPRAASPNSSWCPIRAPASTPPPPPNQIVLVRYPQGLKLTDIYTPLWVSGTLKIEQVSNDLADAAYAIDKARVKVVEEADL